MAYWDGEIDPTPQPITYWKARAEAAEARNKVLETQVDILEQALIDHNCGSPSCLCVGCIEKRDPALGDEHGK